MKIKVICKVQATEISLTGYSPWKNCGKTEDNLSYKAPALLFLARSSDTTGNSCAHSPSKDSFKLFTNNQTTHGAEVFLISHAE